MASHDDARHSNIFTEVLLDCYGAGVNGECIAVRSALLPCPGSSARFARIRGLSLAPKTHSSSFSSDSLLSFLGGGSAAAMLSASRMPERWRDSASWSLSSTAHLSSSLASFLGNSALSCYPLSRCPTLLWIDGNTFYLALLALAIAPHIQTACRVAAESRHCE